MHKIDQEYFFDKGEVGDCVRAVTASILDMDRKDVQHFVKDNPGHQWYEYWESFMKNIGCCCPHDNSNIIRTNKAGAITFFS